MLQSTPRENFCAELDFILFPIFVAAGPPAGEGPLLREKSLPNIFTFQNTILSLLEFHSQDCRS
eukprot:m.736938 g.736938  ORF g.736938 m.736938 type:complete len:64 (+) comp23097_c0_seq25:4452-4643(+)